MKEKIKARLVISSMLISVIMLIVAVVFFVIAMVQLHDIAVNGLTKTSQLLDAIKSLGIGCFFTIASFAGFLGELYRAIAKLEKEADEKREN